MGKLQTLIQFRANHKCLERDKVFDCLELDVAMYMCGRHPLRAFYWHNLARKWRQL
jgi:hypothetical protein